MGNTPVFISIEVLDTGILARNPITIEITNATVISAQSVDGNPAVSPENKDITYNNKRELIQNADKTDKLTIKVNAAIVQDIAANPTTNAIGSQAVISVTRLARKIISPIFVEMTQNKVQNKSNATVNLLSPKSIIIKMKVLITKEKMMPAPLSCKPFLNLRQIGVIILGNLIENKYHRFEGTL
jgi:hypothetical protein